MQSSGETHRENAGVCPVFRIVGMGRSYLMHRHCEEPTGPASAGPMTGSATKQSRLSPRRDSGLRRCARNDGVERPRAQIYHPHAEEAAARGRLEAREPPAGPPSFETRVPALPATMASPLRRVENAAAPRPCGQDCPRRGNTLRPLHDRPALGALHADGHFPTRTASCRRKQSITGRAKRLKGTKGNRGRLC